MDVLHFSTLINADKEKVWHTMLDKPTYSIWTKPFHPNSSFEGNWEEGSEIRFIAPSDNGNAEGMFSRIKKNDKYSFISIEHIGMISNGVVDTTSEQVKKWAPSFENYTFSPKGTQTEVTVDMQIDAAYKDEFEKLWPKALQALKELSEK